MRAELGATYESVDERAGIFIDDVSRVLTGDPDDKPYPSYLVYGVTNNRPLHVVCALSRYKAIVTSAYEPGQTEWVNFKARKKRK